MSDRLFFMIEGGAALDLVRHHIEERVRVRSAAIELARELGAKDVSTSMANGVVVAAQFEGTPHPDFKKPDKWGARPKKGTAWAKRFADQKGYENESYSISERLGIPLEIDYKTEGGSGLRRIGYPLQECGFLFLGKEGPYAMWMPDVCAEVKRDEDRGHVVAEPAKSFVPVFPGCRKIEIEEWDLLVAQHNLENKRAARQALAIEQAA